MRKNNNNININEMKKVILAITLTLCVFGVKNLLADPPMPFGSNSFVGNANKNSQNTVKTAPIGSATALLLCLAGGFVGAKIYKNSNRKD